jgi:hypothetical protein
MSLSHLTEHHAAATHRNPAPRPAARAKAIAPWLEQSILFGMVSAAAGFWIAVIWWIVR